MVKQYMFKKYAHVDHYLFENNIIRDPVCASGPLCPPVFKLCIMIERTKNLIFCANLISIFIYLEL